ncbi:hypothetical protein EVAR_29043_1 [Eumeta japonica]|uniref:Uncharacterized protein n=1 Tax=Eumeta variegata TaxID=151549 RepID=A0A4C1W594_EUMVA|nr:hypothetical protein EVAR_29043_1 [Eumeta japonica]
MGQYCLVVNLQLFSCVEVPQLMTTQLKPNELWARRRPEPLQEGDWSKNRFQSVVDYPVRDCGVRLLLTLQW